MRQETPRGSGGPGGGANPAWPESRRASHPPNKNQKITFAASWTMRGPKDVVGVPNAESFVRVVPLAL